MDDRKARELEQRVRERAYRLWEEEGRPEGRADVHWDQASELVAIEDNQMLATEPLPNETTLGPTGEPVEPVEAVENVGEFPTMTDQGEEQTAPSRRRRRPAETGQSAAEAAKPTTSRGKARTQGSDVLPAKTGNQ